jgi:hypothetical protein
VWDNPEQVGSIDPSTGRHQKTRKELAGKSNMNDSGMKEKTGDFPINRY